MLVGRFNWVISNLNGLSDNPTLKVVMLGMELLRIGLHFLWSLLVNLRLPNTLGRNV